MRTSFWTELLDVVSPRPCVLCGSRLSASESVICAKCHLHLPLTGYEHHPLDNPMARLFYGQFPVERVAALFFYEPKSATSHIIYDLKYHGYPEVGEAMGILAARQFAAAGFFDGIDALVPIPISRRRNWQRGYNQSAEIARGISSVTHLPVLSRAVRRVHFAASQTGLDSSERLRNVADAFCLADADAIAGRHLLVVDDIVTTGATISACGRELAKAPGVRLSVMSLGLTRT